MKNLLIITSLTLNLTNGFADQESYSCEAKEPGSTIATKHMNRFNLLIGATQITLSNIHFLTNAEPATSGCGLNPPTGPQTIQKKTKNGSKKDPFIKMEEFHTDKSDKMITSTCFKNLNIFLPFGASAQASFVVLMSWSDTDGDYNPEGGDSFICQK